AFPSVRVTWPSYLKGSGLKPSKFARALPRERGTCGPISPTPSGAISRQIRNNTHCGGISPREWLPAHHGCFLLRRGRKSADYEQCFGGFGGQAFPSMEHARAWYHDLDYAPRKRLRQAGSRLNLLLVEGSA